MTPPKIVPTIIPVLEDFGSGNPDRVGETGGVDDKGDIDEAVEVMKEVGDPKVPVVVASFSEIASTRILNATV